MLGKKRRIRSVKSYLSDDEAGQSHPSDGADQLHGGAVVDVAVPHLEVFALLLLLPQQVDREAAPLGAARLELACLHVKVASAEIFW